MQIHVDKAKCVASGQCVMLANEVFDQDDDGVVLLLDDQPVEEMHDRIRQASRVCPTGVITVTE